MSVKVREVRWRIWEERYYGRYGVFLWVCRRFCDIRVLALSLWVMLSFEGCFRDNVGVFVGVVGVRCCYDVAVRGCGYTEGFCGIVGVLVYIVFGVGALGLGFDLLFFRGEVWRYLYFF